MKRTSEEAAAQQNQDESDGVEYEEGSQEKDGASEALEPGKKRINMPKKSKFRTRAHVNPMGDLNIPTPLNPDYIDWSIHYPSFFGIADNHKDQVFANTHKHPITYLTDEQVTQKQAQGHDFSKVPTIVDIGCGYGGLMFELSKEFPENMILGMEIRDVVANFVVSKINSSRFNSGYKECMNIGVVKTNTMKTIHNYFKKDSLEKMFFCFADPHFKKQNHRRRIINTTLLSDYAHCMKVGGKIYVISDVKDLFDWEEEHLLMHPLFERVSEEETKADPCIKFMCEGTDEAKKVIKNEGSMWYAVFRKRDNQADALSIDKELAPFYFA